MDLYSYANGDPVNGCDPDGRCGSKANASPSQLEYNSCYGQTYQCDQEKFKYELAAFGGASAASALTLAAVVGTGGGLVEAGPAIYGAGSTMWYGAGAWYTTIAGMSSVQTTVTVAGVLGTGALIHQGLTDPRGFEQNVAYFGGPNAVAGMFGATMMEAKGLYQSATSLSFLDDMAVTAWGDLRGASGNEMWRVGPHGQMPSPRPAGYESHHGVNTVWMDENIAGSTAADAPAVLMLNDPFHNATRGVFNRFRSEIATRQGVSPRCIDWSQVSPGTAWRLAEEQFEAAQVPEAVRAEYFRQFNEYVESLSR